MQKIKTYKEYKRYAIKKLIKKGKEFSFEKVDDRLHYVYRITNKITGIHYYGSKTSTSLDIGIKYFTTSSNLEFKKDFKNNTKNYKIKIVKIFDNKWDKQIYESFLHQYFNVKLHYKFYNKSNQTPTGRDTTGMVTCKDKDGNKLSVSKEEFDSRDDLVGYSKGMMNCIDGNGNLLLVDIDMYYSNPNLKHPAQGTVYCKDSNGDKLSVTKEEFYSRDDLVGLTKGITPCYDLIEKRWLSLDSEIYQNNKERYVNSSMLYGISEETKKKMSESSKGLVTCKDKDGNTFCVTKEEFDNRDDLVGINHGITLVNFDRDKASRRMKENVNCKDLTTGKNLQVTREEYDNNPNLVGCATGYKLTDEAKKKLSDSKLGMVICKDLNGNPLCITKEEYHSRNDVIHINTGRKSHNIKLIEIYNNKDELVYSCDESFAKFCKENNLPYKALCNSYKNNSERLYTSTNAFNSAKVKGNHIYKGWYAVDKGNLLQLNK